MSRNVRLYNAFEVIDTLKDNIKIESASLISFVTSDTDLLLSIYYAKPVSMPTDIVAHIDVTSCLSNLVNKDSEIEALTNKGRKVLLWLCE